MTNNNHDQSSRDQSKSTSSFESSVTNLQPITDTALAAWLHSKGCIIQSTLLKQTPYTFLFLKTPKLFDLMSLWQQGNAQSDSDNLSLECRACFNYERSRRELMRVIKESLRKNNL